MDFREESLVFGMMILSIATFFFSVAVAFLKFLSGGNPIKILFLTPVVFLILLYFLIEKGGYTKKQLLAFMLIIAFFWSFMLVDLSAIMIQVHEQGHAIVCSSFGYTPVIKRNSMYAWSTTCSGLSEKGAFALILLSTGGILAELVFFSILSLFKYIRVYAGFGFVSVALNHLTGCYATDFSNLAKLSPVLGFFNTLLFKAIFLVFSLIFLFIFISNTIRSISE